MKCSVCGKHVDHLTASQCPACFQKSLREATAPRSNRGIVPQPVTSPIPAGSRAAAADRDLQLAKCAAFCAILIAATTGVTLMNVNGSAFQARLGASSNTYETCMERVLHDPAHATGSEADTDGDGMTDQFECANGANPLAFDVSIED